MSVYVTPEVPKTTPVTKPVLSTVATEVAEETHGVTPLAVPEPVNWIEPPTQTGPLPEIVGCVFTITDTGCIVEQAPLVNCI